MMAGSAMHDVAATLESLVPNVYDLIKVKDLTSGPIKHIPQQSGMTAVAKVFQYLDPDKHMVAYTLLELKPATDNLYKVDIKTVTKAGIKSIRVHFGQTEGFDVEYAIKQFKGDPMTAQDYGMMFGSYVYIAARDHTSSRP
jgi:hypothetical protein